MAEDTQLDQEDIPVSDALDRVLSAPTAARGRRTVRVRVYGAVVILYGTATLVVLFWMSPRRFGLNDTQGAWISIGCGILGITILLIAQRFSTLSKKSNGRAESAQQDSDDGGRNELRMDSYHEMTVRHARSSFRNSQIAMGLGLLILTFGAVAVIRSADMTSQLVVGGLTAIGSTFSGFIGRTFLESHNRALEQVNYLFSQPLVSHYLEYSKTVARELSKPELRDKALEQVVRRALDSATASVPIPRSHPGTRLDLARTPRIRRSSNTKEKASAATNGDGVRG